MYIINFNGYAFLVKPHSQTHHSKLANVHARYLMPPAFRVNIGFDYKST